MENSELSILDNFPHTCTARLRTSTSGDLGGSKYSAATLFTGRACWRQQLSQRDIVEVEKRGLDANSKIYFRSDPGLDQRHTVEVTTTNNRTASSITDIMEVRSRAEPDASAGLGVVWRVYAKLTTTGTAP